MAGGVEEHAEVAGLGLVVGLDRSQVEHRGLAGVEVVEVDVEVGLLGDRAFRPRGSLVVVDLLERHLALRGVQLEPPAVGVFDDAASDDGSVELGQCRRIRAVEGGHVEPTDRWLLLHAPKVAVRERNEPRCRSGGGVRRIPS